MAPNVSTAHSTFGGGIEEAAGGRRVEQRRTHQVERAVAGVEGLALVEPAHAVERELDVTEQAGRHRPVAHQGGLRAEVEHRVEVADVVVVVVGDEDPAHVGRVDDREDGGEPASRGRARLPVSTITGSAPRITRLLAGEDAGAARVDGQRGDEERVGGDGMGVGGQESRSMRITLSFGSNWIGLDKVGLKQTILYCQAHADEISAPKRSYNSSRRSLQAAQTRDEVIRAAMARFSATGWAGTTLAAIAEEAGVSVETIYNGFGSKKGLLRAAMDVGRGRRHRADPLRRATRVPRPRRGHARRAHRARRRRGGRHPRAISGRVAGDRRGVQRRRGGRRVAARAREESPRRHRPQPGAGARTARSTSSSSRCCGSSTAPRPTSSSCTTPGCRAAEYEAFLIDASTRLIRH